MKLRLLVLALLAGFPFPELGMAQTVDGGELRGSDDFTVDAADDDDGPLSEETGDQPATAAGENGARTGQGRGRAADARRDANTPRGGRVEPQRPVQPTQPGPRNPDGTVRATPSATPRAVQPEDNFDDDADLYEPLGLRAGAFIIRSSIESTVGTSDNVSRANGGRAGSFYRITPRIEGRSDWSRHQFNFTLRGRYDGYFNNVADDEPSFEGTASGRIDVRDGTRVDIEGSYEYEVEDPSSAEVNPASGTSGIHRLRGTAGVTQDIRRFEVTVNGAVEREQYVNGRSPRGPASTTDDRDNTLTELTMRTGYRVSPALKPFIRGSVFARQYDLERDTNNILRGSTGYSVAGGVDVNLGPKLTGSLALGWRNEELRDNRFDPLEGMTIDGSLVWSPSRLTTVSLTGSTSLDPTTIATSPGSVLYEGQLAVSRSLRRNVRLDVGAGLSYRDYQGLSLQEWRRTATAGITWSFNRNAAAVVRYSYEDLDSSGANTDYRANSIEIGLTLRH